MRRGVRARSWLGPLLLLGACSNEDAGAAPGNCGPKPCASECAALSGDGCNILDEACRERILRAVACVRGTAGELPEIRMLTPEQYRTEQLERLADAGAAGDSDDEDAGAAAGADDEYAAWNTGLQLLGLLVARTEQEQIDESIANLAGFYDQSRRRITLLDRGMAEDGVPAQRLLAHELVHALQDQEYGLAEFHERTPDARDAVLATGCLIEGEAELYAELALNLLHGQPLDPGYWDVTFERDLKYTRRAVIGAPSPYSVVWRLRYPIGERYLADAWLDGGNAAVKALYRGPPNSSIYYMLGYQPEATADALPTGPLACNAAQAPEGFELYTRASFGPLVVFTFLGHLLRDDGRYRTEEAWRDALAWRQDSFAVFTREQTTAVSWRIRFDDAALAKRLAAELVATPESALKVLREGDEIEVLASDDADALGSWNGTDPESCPIDE